MYKKAIGLGAAVLFVSTFAFINLHAQSLVRSESIRIRSSDNTYGSQSVIVYPPSQEPAIYISKYYEKEPTHRDLEVELYQITQDDVLKYLTYTTTKDSSAYDRYSRIPFSVDKLVPVLRSRYAGSKKEKVNLPINENGMWLVRAIIDNKEYTDAVIIRSDVGVLVRETSQNELVFWGQSLRTGKSIKDGVIRLYNLNGTQKLLTTANFASDGTTRLPLDKQADIGLATVDGNTSILILNQPTSYRGERFNPVQLSQKYYIFTDRPLYKPGDTVHFKAIIRNDKDAHYTIPKGVAKIKVLENYSTPVFEKDIVISPEGTISGSYVVPEGAKTGTYYLEVEANQGTERLTWLRGLTSFSVEHYRKPEYILESDAKDSDIIIGDVAEFTLSGKYFFGQPMQDKTIKYKVYGWATYPYSYYSDAFSGDSDYSYHSNYSTVSEGTAVLDKDGNASVKINPSTHLFEGKDGVYQLTAEYIDESGNPTKTSKRILVRGNEYSLYRTSYQYQTKVGEAVSIPLKLTSYSSNPPTGVELKVKARREWWTRTLKPKVENKYGSLFEYKEHKEDFSVADIQTDSKGNAVLVFTPVKSGSHVFSVTYVDRKENKTTKEFYMWVIPTDEVIYGSQNNADITLTKDKEKYLPGETAHITISTEDAPRDAFISLEREGSHRYMVVPLTNKINQISVPILTSDIPNITITASAFSGDSFDYSTNNISVSTDSKKINVAIQPRGDVTKYAPGENVTIDIATTDMYGRPLSADVALWSVDKAIYSLMKDTRGSILKRFWSERYNSTQYAHSLEGMSSNGAEKGCFVAGTKVLTSRGLVNIEEIKIGDTVLTKKDSASNELVKAKVTGLHNIDASGYLILNHIIKITPEHVLWINGSWASAGSIQVGDKLTSSEGKEITIESIEWQKGVTKVYNLEIERYHTFFADNVWVHNDKGGDTVRDDFKDTAYWNPSIRTNIAGRASVTFVLPDNLTTWVMNAVAANEITQVGESIKEIIVTKPVIIRPALPNYIRTGDVVEIAGIAHNFTDSPALFTSSIHLPALNISSTTQPFELLKGGMKNIFWSINPLAADLSSKVTMSLATGEQKDTVEVPLPIKKYGFFETYSKTGQGNAQYAVALHEDSDVESTKATLSLATSFLGTLPTAMEYLVSYPYGCIEQTTSKFVPAVLAKEYPYIYSPFIKKNNVDTIINDGIKRIIDMRQTQTGGWAWWQLGETNPYLTSYVTEYLLRAQKLGYKVDPYIFDEVAAYYKQLQKDREETKAEAVVAAYTLSLLNRQDIKKIITDFDGLTPDIVALGVLTNIKNGYTDPSKNGVNELIRQAKQTENTAYWEAGHPDFFSSTEASTAFALRALVAAGNKDMAERAARHLYQNRPREYWSNSFATAQVIEALSSFSKIHTEANPNMTYSVLLDGKEITKGSMTSLTEEVVVKVPVKNSNQQLEIVKNGTGNIYSTLVVKELRTNDEKTKKLPLKVEREYVGDFTVGGIVTVKLRVSDIPTGSRYLMVEDVLPAGFVPVNPVFSNEYSANPYSNYYYGYAYPSAQEVTPEGMITSFDRITDSEITFDYRARVITRGVFNTPPATALLMYEPDISGRSNSVVVTIDDNPRTVGIKKTDSSKTIAFSVLGFILVVYGGLVVYRMKKKNNVTS